MTEKLLQLDTPNKNGRVYTKEAVEKALADRAAKTTEPFLGTLDFDPMPGLSTNLSMVAFSAGNLRVEGDHLVADIKVLNTPDGQVLADLIKNGVEVDYRTGGLGEVGKDGVVRNFQLTHVAVLPRGRGA